MKKRGLLILLLVLAGVGGYLIYKSMNKPAENGGDDPPRDLPAIISYSVKATYPHDTGSYTQGFVIYKGYMYEGTGRENFSKLRKVDLATRKVLEEIDLDPKVFGEGITILNDTVYQLTYTSQLVYLYDVKDFRKLKEIPLVVDTKQGWGITNDGKQLIVSDGGANLYFFAPGTFQLLRTQAVSEAGSLINNINELEYINGYVYANQYQTPYILKIDPSNGKVVGKIDFTPMINDIKARHPQVQMDVINGIAYDSATKKIYVTGKLWPELYEIQLGQ
jgi:glutaminyl-peptide cyclotransferase